MALTNEHVGPMILAKIKIYVFTRAELLIQVCYETPCNGLVSQINLHPNNCQYPLINYLIGEGDLRNLRIPELLSNLSLGGDLG